MLRKGPIARFVHGIIEYAVGAFLVASPFLLDFRAGGAKAVAIILGIGLIALAASTQGASGIVDQIGLRAHAVLDVVAAAIMVASPFLFDFTDDGKPTAMFLVLGIGYLLLSIGTKFLPDHDR
jgi:hypothetical protein